MNLLLLRSLSHFTIGLLNLGLSIFVYIKSKQDKQKQMTLKFLSLTSFFSFLFNVFHGYHYYYTYWHHEPNSSLYRMAWVGIFIVPSFVILTFYFTNKIKRIFFIICCIYLLASILFCVGVFTPLLTKTVYLEYPTVVTLPGILEPFSRLFFAFFLSLGILNLLKYNSKVDSRKRIQIKYFLLGTFIYAVSGIIFSSLLPLLLRKAAYADIPGLFSIFWLGLTTFAIVRYRLMEIDTVIHRTVMWLATSLWLIMPAYILFKATHLWLKTLSPFWVTMVAMGLFYVFLWYYRYFQPRIDHLFRRRKYDYYEVLNGLGQKIGSELELEKIQGRIFKELKEILYIRKGVLLAQHPGQVGYEEVGSVSGEGITDLSRQAGSSLLSLPFSSKLSQYINKEQKALEREQVEIDPQYQEIKEEALAWLKEKEIEVLIPIVLEGKVNGLIGIGKKENLQGYTRKDIELLENMGQQIGITIDNVLHHGDIIEKERMDEELKLGREIQMNLLPREIPRVPNLSLQGLMIPAKEIGGDYYDFIALPNKEEVAIVIGDVSGKGVAAGLIMATAKATLKGLSQQRMTAKEMLTQANTIICEYTNGEKFMTMLYLRWDSMEKKFRYSSAGHEHILIYRAATEETETILSGGIVLGMLPEIESFLEEKEIMCHFGDKILLYTDGVTDADNQQGERFGLTRLQEAFQRHSRKPAAELIVAVKDEVYGFIGNQPQYDDITLVAMEIE